jgi:hypothetical protein
VSSYTFTITPDDTTNASATLRVNLGASGARITEMTVRAGDGEGFRPEELSGFELSRLIGAITMASMPTPVIEAAIVAEPEVPAVNGRRAPRKAAKASRSRANAPAKRTAATRATAGKATGRKAAVAKAAAKSAANDRRAYRRTPDDFVAVFTRLGSVTETAGHFGVPRHTAQGWVRRLRQQGDLPEK